MAPSSTRGVDTRLTLVEHDLARTTEIVHRLDEAVEKLTEVNANVAKLLAVQEERMSRFMSDRKDDYAGLEELIKNNSDRIKVLERWMWIATGGGAIIGGLMSKGIGPLLNVFA